MGTSYFPLRGSPPSKKYTYFLISLASQCMPWQALLSSWHTNWKKRIQITESFFMWVPGVFSAVCSSLQQQRRWRDVPGRVSCHSAPGRTQLLSVLPTEQHWPSGPLAQWEGTWEMEIFEVNGQKLTQQEMARNKVQKVTSGKHFGLPGVKREYNK